jgi:hypothetical protein
MKHVPTDPFTMWHVGAPSSAHGFVSTPPKSPLHVEQLPVVVSHAGAPAVVQSDPFPREQSLH